MKTPIASIHVPTDIPFLNIGIEKNREILIFDIDFIRNPYHHGVVITDPSGKTITELSDRKPVDGEILKISVNFEDLGFKFNFRNSIDDDFIEVWVIEKD